MRERKKIHVVMVLLLILLVVPLAFSSRYVDLTRMAFFSGNVTTSSSSPTIFLDPFEIVDETLQNGSNFVVQVNASNMLDLFTWHIKVSWNNAILNVSKITYGEFLSRTESPYGTTSNITYGANFSKVFNNEGYTWVAESILGEYPGINGNGSLLSIEFLVVGYGSTNLNINLTGPLETTILDSLGGQIAVTTIDGYFRNAGPGDVNGDGIVDIFDIGSISAHWYPGPPVGTLGYSKDSDINLDGSVDIFDIGITSANWGNTYP